MSTKNKILKGTIILTVSGFITRIIGFYNRIFLSNLIGAKELGIYQLIFPIYMIAFSFCCQGIQTALSKLIAFEIAKKNTNNMKKLISISISISLFLGIIISLFIYFYSSFISINFLNSPECSKCLEVLVFAIPFVAVKACLNGYYYGIENSSIPASSQFFEQIIRISTIYYLSITMFANNTPTALIAVYGLLAGEFLSFVYTLILFIFSFKKQKKYSNKAESSIFLTKELLKLSVPLTLNKLSLTVLQSLESILIPSMLLIFYKNETLSLEIYGTLTGMALPFVLFPSAITNSLAVMLLPAISSAQAQKNNKLIENATSKSLHYCILIGILSTSIFLVYGNSLGEFIFKSAAAGSFLSILSWLCPFIYISTTLSSILNGLGYAKTTLFNNIISIGIRLFFIVIVIPSYGIKGYLIGLLVSYIILVFLDLFSLKKYTIIDFSAKNSIVIPILISIIAIFTSLFFFTQINVYYSPLIATFFGLAILCLVYMIFMFLLRKKIKIV